MICFFTIGTARITLSLALCATSIIASTNLAQAADLTFNWKGDAGYSASFEFTYDQTTAPAIISESGAGATKALQSLNVSFFNPSQELIGTKNEVVNGVSSNQFFEFNFDTTTGNLLGAFDVGTGSGIGVGSRCALLHHPSHSEPCLRLSPHTATQYVIHLSYRTS
ncbi:hypothetical protein A6769_35865 [Nostoc punctiforme NIES-2108]|uniref:PEP-CTERM sorting domain-containing protein n=1 Tax=Nostoc punctiforme NIES-2108 TaxID=1356359 RepID=A0A367QZC6_NOSPU|nr:hypothetical protein A6769_35865 [Nostoc punctiforme NIES-2108]